ncbi:hypothetical protein M2145_001534 [Lachnospiraceae bacterium PF1-21]|uniref:Uncharacterized protein n=1 Tax=Ohessyouella blattaphilus TaxID=2949333 RepID=A0ABT1EID5_9FIRM|nr:hypothetical protein [Ohessyouella blattaphilus]MCP1109527.1 hypothetical protein [Ohessyouella blattaphilus]MCR8562921.1 hypothetical protein [Ohessyouella blattaphilus]MDL2250166.1 hypothetical protein [Lachnospiraceae bacterium OttesenSCG-928-J05]
MMKNYRLGLSRVGVIAVVLVMLPNLMYLFGAPPNDVLGNNSAGVTFLNFLENIGRFGLMIALCGVINKNTPIRNRVVTIAAICSLLAYYVLWIAYFTGNFNGISLVGMAVFPSAFFLLTSWRQRNIFAFAFAALFAVVHISITSCNFL